MTCPECGKVAIFRRGREVECINGHIWRVPDPQRNPYRADLLPRMP